LLVLRCGSLQLLEPHLRLIEHLAAALGGGAKPITVVPGDQLQMGNYHFGPGGARLKFAACGPLGE
jgi:hypothetical protein